MASARPVNARTATAGAARRAKRFTTGNAAADAFDNRATSGARAPIQKATPRPWRKIAGRVNSSGGAVAACPVMASDEPTPTKEMIARARAHHALTSASNANSIATMATSKAGPALVPDATFQEAIVARADSGR